MRSAVGILLAFGLVVAACGGAGEGTTTAPPPGDTSTTLATTAPPTATTTGTDAGPGPQGEGLTATPAAGWTSTMIGEGIKPVLALDSAGSPGIAFLTERIGDGYIGYATAGDDWAIDTFVEGYFYGPIGLAFDGDDRPNIVWHDHQADTFQDDLGSLAYAVRTDGTWQVGEATDDGHDGWDSTIAIGADGVVRAAGIDPAQFNRTDGVEYYELQGGTWTVEAIGSGPIFYEFNVGLAVGADGTPLISYYDNNQLTLQFARRSAGSWSIETVDSEVDAGKYSDVEVDAGGRAHISYLHQDTSTTGTVRYAVEDGSGGWTIEDVGRIEDLVTGFTGARRVTALELDDAGNPHVAFGDRSGIWYASRADGSWAVSQILAAGDLELGQLVSMELDTAGMPHVAYFEVTAPSPLAGVVAYMTKS